MVVVVEVVAVLLIIAAAVTMARSTTDYGITNVRHMYQIPQFGKWPTDHMTLISNFECFVGRCGFVVAFPTSNRPVN